MTLLKAFSGKIDEEIQNCTKQMEEIDKRRKTALKEIGNLLHDTCVISNDEDVSESVLWIYEGD